MHNFVVGANDVLVHLPAGFVDDPAMFIVLPGVLNIGLALARDNIVVGRSPLSTYQRHQADARVEGAGERQPMPKTSRVHGLPFYRLLTARGSECFVGRLASHLRKAEMIKRYQAANCLSTPDLYGSIRLLL